MQLVSNLPLRRTKLNHRNPDSKRRGGFALVIALLLMGLMVSLVLSLSSLTLVETASTTQAVKRVEARENAKFALLEALGQLQRFAGHDQRVTARADINSANTGSPAWTGVWDATPADTNNPSHALAPSDNEPLAWLVNGGTADDPLSPQAPVAEPSPSNNNVWLVKSFLQTDLAAEQQVKVKTSEISGTDNDGRYAFWIGDVGIMASLAVVDESSVAISGSDEQVRKLTIASEFDAEMLSPLSAVFQKQKEESEDAQNVFRDQLSRLSNYEELLLLNDGDGSVTPQNVADLLGNASAQSSIGVLSDTLRGGLRRDLTRGLSENFDFTEEPAMSEIGEGLAIDFGNYDQDGRRILPDPGPVGMVAPQSTYTNKKEPAAPTWDFVRSYVNNRAGSDNSMAPAFAPFATLNNYNATPSATHPVMPIVTMIELRFGVDISGSTYKLVIQPNLILCNPYNVTLEEADYCVMLKPRSNAKKNPSPPGVEFNVSDSTQPHLNQKLGPLSFANHLGNAELAFNITDSFKPGEVKVYSLPMDQGMDSNTGGVVELKKGYTASNILIDTGIHIDPLLTAEGSKAKIEIEEIAQPHPSIILAGGHATAGSFPVPSQIIHYVETEPSLMDIKYDKETGSKQTKPYARMEFLEGSAPTNTLSLITFRFTLTTPSNGYLTSGNQPGSANHELPNDHPARTSSGGTAKEESAGMRSLIDANPRALLSQRLAGWDNSPLFHFDSYRNADYQVPVAYDMEHAFWGGSIEDDGNGSSEVILFNVLRENDELVSLGQLAHVNWGTGGKHPAYPLGNSYASIFYEHDSRDFSYALNEALWDRFFFSSLPEGIDEDTTADLANSRLVFYDANALSDLSGLGGMRGYDEAAAHLMINGAFNVNSTSVDAWAAFLAGIPQTNYGYEAPDGAAQTDGDVRPYLRMRRLHANDPRAQQGQLYEWSGYRTLSGEELYQIAEQIVLGIKERGRPSRSLAEFLNRDLNVDATNPRNQKGIVQAAIDYVVNQDDPSIDSPGKTVLDELPGVIAANSINQALIVEEALINADNPDAARGKLRATGAPGFVMQSDLITPLAPAMSARSDTFMIRAYGDSRNPITNEIEGRAWCEAYVQRLPIFLNDEPPETALEDLAAESPSRKLGRRFVITSFRWLSDNEI
ncbi:hypothetical protein [Cerasicoccus fimbriatus]|uniref:hypothetical protein n=1 Tax=Cerasicoccus fimbriatus TaxID=3014554 RepID=UPI0022B2F6FF|nr:hypothetical protein [Cerasicoccus sp. TK19100]